MPGFKRKLKNWSLKKSELNDILNTPTSDSALLIETAKDLEKLTAEIDAKTNRWFELSALMESA